MKITRRRFLAAAGAASADGRESAGRSRRSDARQYPLKLDNVRDGVLRAERLPGRRADTARRDVSRCGRVGTEYQLLLSLADEFGFIVLAPDSRSELTWIWCSANMAQTSSSCRMRFARPWAGARSTLGGSPSRDTPMARVLALVRHRRGDVFGHVIAMSPGVLSPVAARGKPKIFISHGVSDTTMPIDDTSRKFVPRLKGLGYDVTYREYEGGHGRLRRSSGKRSSGFNAKGDAHDGSEDARHEHSH
jgi:hypothetical protein